MSRMRWLRGIGKRCEVALAGLIYLLGRRVSLIRKRPRARAAQAEMRSVQP